MTSIRKRKKRIRFASAFTEPTPYERCIRQALRDSGDYTWPDHAIQNWTRELGNDETRLAEVRQRLAALKEHLPGMTYDQVRALGLAAEEAPEPAHPDDAPTNAQRARGTTPGNSG